MPEVRAFPMIITGEPVEAGDGRWIGRENGIEAMAEFPRTKNIWLNAAETVPNSFDLPKM